MDLYLTIPPPSSQLPSFFELSLLRILKDALLSAVGDKVDMAMHKMGLQGWEDEGRALVRGVAEWKSVKNR